MSAVQKAVEVARQFPCILADPPWRFRDAGSRLSPHYSGNGRKNAHYGVMMLEDIMRLPIPSIASENAHLWLWSPNALVLDGQALRVVEAWGFEPKQIIPWIKTDSKGKPRLGGGHYTRVCSEMLILAVRGRLPPQWKGEPGVVLACRNGHSEKPTESYGLIERVSPSPRLELFARKERKDWVTWGNEVEGPEDLTKLFESSLRATTVSTKKPANLVLHRGTIVVAKRHLDKEGANVRPGTQGVVFEESDAYGDGAGPMVRWSNMGACNVYPGDVESV